MENYVKTLICFFLTAAVSAKLIRENNQFGGVVVAISSNIDIAFSENLTSQLQDVIHEASDVLNGAGIANTQFDNITLLYPPTWDDAWDFEGVQAENGITFRAADIRIVPCQLETDPAAKWVHSVQSEGCGRKGEYIVMCDVFLTQSESSLGLTEGIKGKLLAKEWIQYRYGVFDENGIKGSDMYPQTYASHAGVTDFNVCADSTVSWVDNGKCLNKTTATNLPKDCDLIVNQTETNIESSFMSEPLIEVASKVCNAGTHNRYAPNKHNSLCFGRSVTEILNDHADIPYYKYNETHFRSFGATRMVNATTQPMKLLLILDTYNVNDNLLVGMSKTLRRYFNNHIPNTMLFSRMTSSGLPQPSNLQQITPNVAGDIDNTMKTLNSQKQPSHEVLSDVILQASQVIAKNPTTSKGTILLITNRLLTEEQQQDMILKLMNQIASDSTLHVITTSYDFSLRFDPIAKITDGKVFSVAPSTAFMDINANNPCIETLQTRLQMELALQTIFDSLAVNNFQSRSVISAKQYTNAASSQFYVDQSLEAQDTYLVVLFCEKVEDSTNFNITITYGNNSYYRNDRFFDQYSYTAKTTAIGTWHYDLNFNADKPFLEYMLTTGLHTELQMANSLYSSKSEALQLSGKLTTDSMRPSLPAIVALLEVNSVPILNAEVTAIVDTSEFSREIKLLDNGAGADITASDGIYSQYAYLTGLAEGNYSFSITLKVNIEENGNVIQRYQFIGTSNVTIKNITLARVTDVVLKSVNQENRTIGVGWTAVGTSSGSGLASAVAMVCHTNIDTLLNNADSIPELSRWSNDIQDVGLPEDRTAVVTNGFLGSTQYCGIRVYDENGNASPVSNVISFYMSGGDGGDGDDFWEENLVYIVIGALGLLLIIIIIILIVVCCWLKRIRKKNASSRRSIQTKSPQPVTRGHRPAQAYVNGGFQRTSDIQSIVPPRQNASHLNARDTDRKQKESPAHRVGNKRVNFDNSSDANQRYNGSSPDDYENDLYRNDDNDLHYATVDVQDRYFLPVYQQNHRSPLSECDSRAMNNAEPIHAPIYAQVIKSRNPEEISRPVPVNRDSYVPVLPPRPPPRDQPPTYTQPSETSSLSTLV